MNNTKEIDGTHFFAMMQMLALTLVVNRPSYAEHTVGNFCLSKFSFKLLFDTQIIQCQKVLHSKCNTVCFVLFCFVFEIPEMSTHD